MLLLCFFLLIGSYCRQCSSGVLLNLHTMINLPTSLACIPWQHLATACFQKVVSLACLKGYYPIYQRREIRIKLLSLGSLSPDFAVIFFKCFTLFRPRFLPTCTLNTNDSVRLISLMNPPRGLFLLAFLGITY